MPLKLIGAIISAFFALLAGIFAYSAPIRLALMSVGITYLLIALACTFGLLHYVDCVCAEDTEDSK